MRPLKLCPSCTLLSDRAQIVIAILVLLQTPFLDWILTNIAELSDAVEVSFDLDAEISTMRENARNKEEKLKGILDFENKMTHLQVALGEKINNLSDEIYQVSKRINIIEMYSIILQILGMFFLLLKDGFTRKPNG